jgi:hypothetical protein
VQFETQHVVPGRVWDRLVLFIHTHRLGHLLRLSCTACKQDHEIPGRPVSIKSDHPESAFFFAFEEFGKSITVPPVNPHLLSKLSAVQKSASKVNEPHRRFLDH